MVGTRLGAYEVTAKLGEGGMGVVYRATDTTLGRDVAIKVLPEAVAQDAERLARFEREARTLASLNHPGIAAIYGFESSDGTRALVMELVEGPTLADRIAQGPIPPDEALPIARQIAEALEVAHEQGIVHRDLKPANVKVRPDGTVKVLDFGLAKALEPAGAQGASSGQSMSPTITTPAMTQAGMILGTAAYMSPEQARGKVTDTRADIWAFGVVLFEMLTGKRAFGADEVSDTLAFVLTRELDWNTLPEATPPSVRWLVRRCLDRDVRRRLRHIGEARVVLEGAAGEEPGGQRAARETERAPVWRAVLPWVVAGVAIVAAVAAGWPRGQTRPPIVALEVSTRGDLPFREGPLLALSPDGRTLAFRSPTEDDDRLYLRHADSLEVVPLEGTEAGENPFFSPDGAWLGFTTQEGALWRVPIGGGQRSQICTCGVNSRGAWLADQTVIFFDSRTRALSRVAADGGEPEMVLGLDEGETYFGDPVALPGRNVVLFTVFRKTLETAEVAALALDTRDRKRLIEGFFPQFSPSGHLLFARRGGTVWAVPFDVSSLEATGDPVPAVENVRIEGGGSVQFDLSDSGSIAYVQAGTGERPRTLVWVDRSGNEEPVPGLEARGYSGVQLSKDGSLAAIQIEGAESLEDISVYDIASGEPLRRLTFDPAFDSYPVWMPDGRRLLFNSGREGTDGLYVRQADGAGQPERRAELETDSMPSSVDPDGTVLLYQVQHPRTGWDVMQVPLDGSAAPEGLLSTSADERYPRISPDGRWLAYASDELNRMEVFVRPFPDVLSGGPWPVSLDGGEEPLWSRDGTEIFYRRGNTYVAASIRATSTVSVTRRVDMFSGPYRRAIRFRHHSYDVTPDGQRFLMIREPSDGLRAGGIVWVQNWVEELERLMSAD